MVDQSTSNTFSVFPLSLSFLSSERPAHQLDGPSRRFSSSSAGSLSDGGSFPSKKLAIGKLAFPTRSNPSKDSASSIRQHRPTMLGYPPSLSGAPEHWNTFHKRFQTKERSTRSGRGTFSRIACRMFFDCARTMGHHNNGVSDDWSETYEVPMSQSKLEELRQAHWYFWEDDSEDEECRVELTE